jgi:hypothetical protein
LLPADVAALLERLLSGARDVLGERFVGLYLYGSLATGDFAPERSDVDFLIVTEYHLSDDVVAALGAMHARLIASGDPWAANLEGSYIPRAAMRRWDPADARHPHLAHDAPFQISEHGADWVIQRHVLREHAVVMAGPAPRSFIDPVTPAQLRAAIARLLREFWAERGSSDEFLRPREYQVFAVQTMCRALHTLACGEISSKPVAARWAIANLPEPWPAVVGRALAWPHGDQADGLDETRALIRYVLAGAR